MIQLNHSQNVNTNAVYPDYPAPIGLNTVALVLTQSINNSATKPFSASLANTVTPTNPWLVIQITGSNVPTASGQYIANTYDYTLSGLGTWGSIQQTFGTTQEIWGGNIIVLGQLLSTDRAFVSGTNEYSINQYLLPVNNYYYQYNYPK